MHWCAAALLYAHGGQALVGALKFRGDRSALAWSAAAMAQLVNPEDVDLITWAPTSPARARRRGSDQAETLARAVAARLGVPARALLARQPGPTQAHRSRLERHHGVVFRARSHNGLSSLRIVIVDDVVTTGATLLAACFALNQAGPRSVNALTLARADRTVGPSMRLRPATSRPHDNSVTLP
jgi:predicted amidophosphoribosyltransferase